MKKCKKCGKEFEVQKGLLNYCSLQCKNSRTWTDEDKKKLSMSAKNSEKVKEANKLPRNRKDCNISTICKSCGKLIYHKSYRPRKYHSECWLKSSGGLRKNSTRVNRSFYKGFQMDSGAERYFAELLDTNKIKWIKNENQYFYYTRKDGKDGKYYPDFFLIDYNYWVEIKGKIYAEKDENLDLKLNSVERIVLIYSSDLKESKGNIEKLLPFIS